MLRFGHREPRRKLDGRSRTCVRSRGARIAPTKQGLSNFWEFFAGSVAADASGPGARPAQRPVRSTANR